MMLTRCPSCGTSFRVTPEQLKVRAGKVRCGHCNSIFNALETLVDSHPAAAPEAAEAVPPAVGTEEPAPETAAGSASEPVASIAAAPQSRPSRRGSVLWSLATFLMLALFGAQTAYLFRGELILLAPELRPGMEEFCAKLDCDLPLPRKPELVGIEASDLHPDPQQNRLLVLAATLKNRASFAQAFPYLELTLTDTRDQPLARRVMAPEDYLPRDAKLQDGFAAEGELAVNLWLDTAGIAATGYRIYLFYP